MGKENSSVQNKDDITKIINEMIKIHGINSANLILDALLGNYNPNLLIDILRTKIKENNEKPNSSFIIGLEVYLTAYINETKQKSAIKNISDKYGIKENTVKTHIDNFRKFIKKDMEEVEYFKYSSSSEDITRLINDFVKELHGAYMGSEPERKEAVYKKDFQNFRLKESIPF